MQCTKALYPTPELSYVLGYYSRFVDNLQEIMLDISVKHNIIPAIPNCPH
jgi:hypothetical protein